EDHDAALLLDNEDPASTVRCREHARHPIEADAAECSNEFQLRQGSTSVGGACAVGTERRGCRDRGRWRPRGSTRAAATGCGEKRNQREGERERPSHTSMVP